MNRCLTTPDFLDFISILLVEISPTTDGIIVHALAGDVHWIWTGTMWCW